MAIWVNDHDWLDELLAGWIDDGEIDDWMY